MRSSIRGAFVAAFLLALRVGVDAQATVAAPRTPGEPMFSVSEEEDQAHASLVCQSYTQDGSATFQNGRARSDIVVQEHYRVDDVRVSGITMKHPRVGALHVALRGVSLGPRGLDSLHEKSVTLVNRKGKRGQDYLFTGFSDQASSSFPDARDAAPYTGMWTPAQPLRMLTRGPGVKAGNGGSSGVWSLLAEDRLGLSEEDVEGAEISSWTLQLCYNKVEETLRQEAQEEAFAHFDADNDGHLSMDEYQAALDELKRLNLPEEDLIDMFGELDRNNNDLVSLEDFLQHHSEEDINKLKESLEMGLSGNEGELEEESSSFLCNLFPNLSLCSSDSGEGERIEEGNQQPEQVAALGVSEAGTIEPAEEPADDAIVEEPATEVASTRDVTEPPEASNPARLPRYCNVMPFLPSCRRISGQQVNEEERWTVSAQQVNEETANDWTPPVCRLFPQSAACQSALARNAEAPEPEEMVDDYLEDATAQSFSSFDLSRSSSSRPTLLDRNKPVVYEVLDVLSKASLENGILGSKWAEIDNRLDLTDRQKQNIKLATIAATVGWSTFLIKKLEHSKHGSLLNGNWSEDKTKHGVVSHFIGPKRCSCVEGYPKDVGCLLFDWQCRDTRLSEGNTFLGDYLERFNRVEGLDMETEEIDGPSSDDME
mmetsp:Transcript_9764/g.59344  ORF Transcript_9764/g.59344 Transcript_9764/m.59344 type:complete len:655 (+) Transcript_9764:441-2405(+)